MLSLYVDFVVIFLSVNRLSHVPRKNKFGSGTLRSYSLIARCGAILWDILLFHSHPRKIAAITRGLRLPWNNATTQRFFSGVYASTYYPHPPEAGWARRQIRATEASVSFRPPSISVRHFGSMWPGDLAEICQTALLIVLIYCAISV